jgi:uncharacterized protein (DUF983 family)
MRSSADPGTGQLKRVLARALRMRCPSCGQAAAFTSWFHMRDRCPVCHFFFERGDGYFIGATCINLVAAIILPAMAYAVVLAVTWPNAAWLGAAIAAIVLAVLVPVLFYPFARIIWLALDLVIRPIQPDEYVRPHALD